jgi:hypothetical protein
MAAPNFLSELIRHCVPNQSCHRYRSTILPFLFVIATALEEVAGRQHEGVLWDCEGFCETRTNDTDHTAYTTTASASRAEKLMKAGNPMLGNVLWSSLGIQI